MQPVNNAMNVHTCIRIQHLSPDKISNLPPVFMIVQRLMPHMLIILITESVKAVVQSVPNATLYMDVNPATLQRVTTSLRAPLLLAQALASRFANVFLSYL